MSGEARPSRLAMTTAEDVLQRIYGDDLHGCTVTAESIASIIEHALQERAAEDTDLIELYEKLVEVLQLLAIPPGSVSGPDELRTLLGERLDTIRDLVEKTIQATARLKAERSAGANGD